MIVHDLGLIPFSEAEAVQAARLEEVAAGAEETLYLLEHPPVITVGKGGGLDNIHVSGDWLAGQGVDVVHIRRGGNVTCHFPGQLVAYPVFRITKRKGGVRSFFWSMEEVVMRVLKGYGLDPGRVPGRPGVYMDGRRKIGSMGIGVRRWTTYHGLSLNVSRDLKLFDVITLCGLDGVRATSINLELERQGHGSRAVDMKDVKNAVAKQFRAVFADTEMAEDQAALGPGVRQDQPHS